MRDRSQYWKEYSEKRRQDPAYREQQARWNKTWRAKNGRTPERLARKAEQMRAYREAHGTAEHHRARWAVSRAIKAGRLLRQPCEVCGEAKVHAHHDDYGKPLDVRWLCPAHHREHHAKATGETP